MSMFEVSMGGEALEMEIDVKYNVIRKGIDFLINNYYEEISLEDVSSAANFSRFHYCRLFKKVVGIGPGQWLIGFRVLAAVNMMQKFPKSVLRDVAFPCGFKSSAHFCRSIKKFFGVNPLELRAQLNAEGSSSANVMLHKISDLQSQLRVRRMPSYI